MRRASILLACILATTASGAPQKYAPAVGAWRVDVRLGDTLETLEFVTDGEGVYGVGIGWLAAPGAAGEPSRKFPATWENRSPEKIRISSEIDLETPSGARLRGTLLLRVRVAPNRPVAGDALFVDEELRETKGTATLTRTKGPEDLLSSGT
jgi:hypothetical protein